MIEGMRYFEVAYTLICSSLPVLNVRESILVSVSP
jgi:hypothetical protein